MHICTYMPMHIPKMWVYTHTICTHLLLFSHAVVSDSFVTPWTVLHLAPLSMGFPSQECWSGLPFPPPGDLHNRGIEPMLPALAGGFFTTEPPGKYVCVCVCVCILCVHV